MTSGPRPSLRTCVGCRATRPRTDLLRVVAVEGVLVPDPSGRSAGRGAHLHPDLRCLALAERRRAWPRALRVPGPLDSGRLVTYLQTTSDVSGTPAGDDRDRKQGDPIR